MNTAFENIPLVKNEKLKRFEIEVNGDFAFINYGEYGDHVAPVHTEAEPELVGTGAQALLSKKHCNTSKRSSKH